MKVRPTMVERYSCFIHGDYDTPPCPGCSLPTCKTCHLPKKPIGRDAGVIAANRFCDSDCDGYMDAPRPRYLWPSEVGRDD